MLPTREPSKPVLKPVANGHSGGGDCLLERTNGCARRTSDVIHILQRVEQARIPGLFNTGVDNLGHPLTDNATDVHYARVKAGLTQVPVVAAGSSPLQRICSCGVEVPT